MEESRKVLLAEKLATKSPVVIVPIGKEKEATAGKAAYEWAKTVGRKAVDPGRIGDSISKGLAGEIGKVVGVKAAILAAKHFKPKKTLIQKMVGKDTPGRRALMFGAGAAGIGAGLKGVESLADAISGPMKKKKYFKNMMSENPSLNRENPGDVKKIFRTLYTFNPVMASDPLVAGSFMKRSLQFKDEGIQPVDIKTLVEVAKNLRDSKKKDSLLRGAFVGTGAELMSYSG
ncbi:MAG: hypothetical protein CL582_21895 [Alteromonadaceae bacterium]|nr:hypothetical protein [Alteromonadaceae bacterium]|tara:strand:- start:432 stop:1124 length:693 start_codon:yes stop_codon:yes gene_type:complete